MSKTPVGRDGTGFGVRSTAMVSLVHPTSSPSSPTGAYAGEEGTEALGQLYAGRGAPLLAVCKGGVDGTGTFGDGARLS